MGPSDVSVWNVVLSDAKVLRACIMLRMCIRGPVYKKDETMGRPIVTFVLCGLPKNGAFLLKALWPLGRDEYMHSVYRDAVWAHEGRLLGALEVFLRETASPDSHGRSST